MSNYYSHQDDCLFQMRQNKFGAIFAPTGTGKGEIISRHNRDVLTKKTKKKTIKITVIVAHRILLSQQLIQRAVSFFLDNNPGTVPFKRICVHSGDGIEYGREVVEEQIWLGTYPDDKCGSLDALTASLKNAVDLGHDVVISTTYHSLPKTTKVLHDLGLKATVAYLDEIHRPTAQDDQFKSLKDFIKMCDSAYGFTATPGKQQKRILSLFGNNEPIFDMTISDAIVKGLICKPKWMIVDVNGNRHQHLAKGVITAYKEHQKRIPINAKMLVHTRDSQEIATIADSKEIAGLLAETSGLIVAEISSSRGARINGRSIDERQEWLKVLNNHSGPMIVLHIDICNAGLDVPGFTFGLWTYMSSSETYSIQGNGRHGRIVKEDRVRLERGEISTADYSTWVKPDNICGLLSFDDDLEEDRNDFIDFILRSREVGFRPEDTIYTGTRVGVEKPDPFDDDVEIRAPYRQSSLQVAITVALENEARKELHHYLKKLDPMNIFDARI